MPNRKLKPTKRSEDAPKTETPKASEAGPSADTSNNDGFQYDKPLPPVTGKATIVDARSPDYAKLIKPTIVTTGTKRPPYKSKTAARQANADKARTEATLAEKAKGGQPDFAKAVEASQEPPTDGTSSPKPQPPSATEPDGKQLESNLLKPTDIGTAKTDTSKDLRYSVGITSGTLPSRGVLTSAPTQPKEAEKSAPTPGTPLPPLPSPVSVRIPSGREQAFAAKLKDLNIGQSGFITFPEFLQLCPRVGLEEESYKA
ncbi:unnamed protein product, partial [Dibothriocephalus latus]